MAADDAREQSEVAQMIEATVLAVTLAGRIDQRQIARSPEPLGIAGPALEEQFLERDGDVFRETDAHEAAGGDGIAVADQPDRLARRYDLACIRGAQGRRWMLGQGHVHSSTL